MTGNASTSRAAMPEFRVEYPCSDCGAPTIYRDPDHGVPCCLKCLSGLYAEWEFSEKHKAGEFGV